jgi:hypothetical protein
MYKFDGLTGKITSFREKIFTYDGPGKYAVNMNCSTFTDRRKKVLPARCVISNLDLSEVVDIDLLEED